MRDGEKGTKDGTDRKRCGMHRLDQSDEDAIREALEDCVRPNDDRFLLVRGVSIRTR